MGHVQTEIVLVNPRRPELEPMTVTALVNTGAVSLCIPEHIQTQLDLEVAETREATMADGSRRKMDYVGPVHVQFGSRSSFTGALVMGDEVLLGCIPLEDMDLVVNPKLRTLTVNPDSPNYATNRVK